MLDFISVHLLRFIFQFEYAVPIINPCDGVIMKGCGYFRRYGLAEGSSHRKCALGSYMWSLAPPLSGEQPPPSWGLAA